MSKSNNYNDGGVSKLELMNISQILFDADSSDFMTNVMINYQGFLNSSNVTEDRAPLSWEAALRATINQLTTFSLWRLLTVDPAVYAHATIKKMKILYDNFDANSSIDEVVTREEEEEESDFIAALLETSVMK